MQNQKNKILLFWEHFNSSIFPLCGLFIIQREKSLGLDLIFSKKIQPLKKYQVTFTRESMYTFGAHLKKVYWLSLFLSSKLHTFQNKRYFD